MESKLESKNSFDSEVSNSSDDLVETVTEFVYGDPEFGAQLESWVDEHAHLITAGEHEEQPLE